MANIGGSALMLVLGLVALYLGYKYFRRRLVLRELRMARITAEELREKQDGRREPGDPGPALARWNASGTRC